MPLQSLATSPVLGIETSCDETAAAVVSADRTILANVVLSQTAAHARYGGVVPEIAARAHLDHIDRLVAQALTESGCSLHDMVAIAATGGPGLIGGVMVGVTFAKSLACVAKKPFIAVNHLEGHALTARLTNDIAFPYVLLLVSGGHCQTLIVEAVGRYRRLGTTLDDAAGEAFDKAAKLMALGFPGGPAIERAARAGRADRVPLPRPMRGRPGFHFSFSGLKTAVRQTVEALAAEDRELRDGVIPQALADIAASFQQAVADVLQERCARALEFAQASSPAIDTLVVAGGVAANLGIRKTLSAMTDRLGVRLVVPPPALCTDNGAMIAWAGLERWRLGLVDGLDFRPRPRWPLDPDAPPAAYAGVKA